jgi:hypothetical protein
MQISGDRGRPEYAPHIDACAQLQNKTKTAGERRKTAAQMLDGLYQGGPTRIRYRLTVLAEHR